MYVFTKSIGKDVYKNFQKKDKNTEGKTIIFFYNVEILLLLMNLIDLH